jgi:gliding motility-associated-like protein
LKVKFLLLWVVIFTTKAVQAQNAVQNCLGAIPICQNTYVQPNAYIGSGSMNELNPSNQGCLTTGENNSVWYLINVNTNGSLVFTITPTTASDYDFAVWDLTDKSCSAIGAGLSPIRCNYASLANSTPGGLTGLSSAAALPSVGAGGGSFSSAINATAGQTFAILINNSSASTSGYTINFNGSTCQILDNIAPSIKSDSIVASCSGPSSLYLLLNENVTCSSFATNGSDFALSPAIANISSASSSACLAGGAFTNAFTLNFSSPLPPGTYTLSVVTGSDGNTLVDNCGNAMPSGSSISFTVAPPVQIALNTQMGCPGTPSGVITANNVGGNAPFLYKLNGGAYTSNSVFSGLFPGNYTLTIKDNFGCTDDSVVNLQPGTFIQIDSLLVSNLQCYGANTGGVQVIASGGTLPLYYSIGTSTYNALNSFGGLAPGNYFLHVKDANGCIKDTTAFISSPGQITINSLILTHASCGNTNGSIQVNAYGGTAPLQYAINSSAFQTTGNFSNLAQGNYTLHVLDAHNCIRDSLITIQAISLVSVNNVTLTQPLCSTNTGSFVVSGIGGTTPYAYSVNGAAYTSNSTFTSLQGGSYTITIKDANGCTASSVTSINTPTPLLFGSTSTTIPTCLVNGSISTSGIGGSSPYLFSLNGGGYSASSSFGPLVPGNYTLYIKDNHGCTRDTFINLATILTPSISGLNLTQASCSFPNGGSIQVISSGGTAPISYSLNGGAASTIGSFNGLSGGSYTVTVTDANGCSTSSSAAINSSNTLSFSTLTSTNIGCGGTPLGSINATLVGGNLPYQYSTNGGLTSTSGSFSNLYAGTYTVIAQDASGCTKSSTITLTSSSVLQIDSIQVTNSFCQLPGSGSISIIGTGSAPPITYSINGAPPVSNGVFTGLVPNYYLVKIIDANGCKVDTTVQITSPLPLYFTNPQVLLPFCYGGTGSISVLGTGGTPPYTFSLNYGIPGNSSAWNNLTSGSYTVQIQDANGCKHDTTFILLDPPKIDVSNVQITNASCSGAPTGSITITPSNGTLPYQYALNGGAWSTQSTFSALGAGVYTISVNDAVGCAVTKVVTLNSGGNFSINNISSVSPSCPAAATGSITLTASGGIAPYSYALNSGSLGVSNQFSGLISSSYTLHAKDSSGCVADSIFFLSGPAALHFSNLQFITPSCYGGNDGKIQYSIQGGTAPYQANADGGSYTSLGTLTNLSAGTHTLGIQDSHGCLSDSVISMQSPSILSFSNIQIIQPGCQGSMGKITPQGNGGTSPYLYAIGNGPYSSNNQFNNLPVGTYTLHIKDNKGCSVDSVVSISQVLALHMDSLSYSPLICTNTMSGFISAFANSTNPPVLYSYNGGTGQTNGNFNNIPSGTYTVHAIDYAGCYVDSVINILSTPTISINSLITVSPLCHDANNGSIDVQATGGIGSLTFSCNTNPYSNNSLLSGLTHGTYTVHVKDSLGCVRDSIKNLSAPSALSFSNIGLEGPFCSNATNGKITMQAQGGTWPYLYAINNSLYTTNNVFQNLMQDSYTLHVKDYNGCVFDSVISLDAQNYMDFTNVQIHDVSCKYGNDGSISLQTIGGNSPYQYTINSLFTGSGSNFTNLASGQYTIMVTDLLGCQADTIIPVSEPIFSVQAGINQMGPNLCRGDSIGWVSMTGLGGTTPYSYSIGNGYQTSTTFTGLTAGLYTLSIKDNLGCTDDTLAYISEPDTSIQIIVTGMKEVSCMNVNDGEITIASNYGAGTVNYIFNGVSMGTDTFYNHLSPGNYIIEVHDSLGCRSTGKLVMPPSNLKPSMVIDSIGPVVCTGDKTGSIDWHTRNTYPPYYYTLDSVYLDTISYVNHISNGEYALKVSDSRGCYTDTIVVVREQNPMTLEILASPASCSGVGSDGKADAIVTGGIPPYFFIWSGNNWNHNSHVEDLTFGIQMATVADSLGCRANDSFEVSYTPCCQIEVPNAFSPNGDGTNDVFRLVQYGEIDLQSFEVYNRWGNQIFSTKSPTDAWDGKYLGTSCEVGTYFYIIRYHCHLQSESKLIKGDILLIK